MMKLITATVIALSLVSSAAFAQGTTPAAPAADAGVVAKFKSVDKNGNGSLDGVEVDAYKANMAKIDTNKDGKISETEFVAATKAGTIR